MVICYAGATSQGPVPCIPGVAKEWRTMVTPPTGFPPVDEALYETLNQYFVIEIWIENAATTETPAI